MHSKVHNKVYKIYYLLNLTITVLEFSHGRQNSWSESDEEPAAVDGYYWYETVESSQVEFYDSWEGITRTSYHHRLDIHVRIDREIEPWWGFGPMFGCSCFEQGSSQLHEVSEINSWRNISCRDSLVGSNMWNLTYTCACITTSIYLNLYLFIM